MANMVSVITEDCRWLYVLMQQICCYREGFVKYSMYLVVMDLMDMDLPEVKEYHYLYTIPKHSKLENSTS